MSEEGGIGKLFKSVGLRITVLTLLILGGGWYAWSLISLQTHGLPPNPAAAGDPKNPMMGMMSMDGSVGPPSPERINQMMDLLHATDEQKSKVRALLSKGEPQTREERRERRDAMEQIATPEQRQAVRQMMRSAMQARMERARKILSPEDFTALQRRAAARFGGRGGRGAGGGPNPGPPPAR